MVALLFGALLPAVIGVLMARYIKPGALRLPYFAVGGWRLWGKAWLAAAVAAFAFEVLFIRMGADREAIATWARLVLPAAVAAVFTRGLLRPEV